MKIMLNAFTVNKISVDFFQRILNIKRNLMYKKSKELYEFFEDDKTLLKD